MKIIYFSVVLAVVCVSGCSTPGARYAKAHPELSATHHQILTSGKAPAGPAIEGMTKEQVQLALGKPTAVEIVGGKEAWTYIREMIADERATNTYSPGGGFGSTGNFLTTTGSQQTKIVKTTVFFKGDRATLTELAWKRGQ